MPTRGHKDVKPLPRRALARTPEARENQVIADAIDLAEKQIREGTASSQVITHFLKLGSTRERLEQVRLQREVELLTAKASQMADAKDIKELYQNAIDAFKVYSGQEVDNGEDPNLF